MRLSTFFKTESYTFVNDFVVLINWKNSSISVYDHPYVLNIIMLFILLIYKIINI